MATRTNEVLMVWDIGQFAEQVRVVGGGWAGQLRSCGLPTHQRPETWNLEQPEQVAAVARSYVEAGSDVIVTNTIGGNDFVLAGCDAADRVAELCRAGAEIAKRAVAGKAKVFGSIGSTGKIVKMGEAAAGEISAAFEEAAGGLAEGGVDAIILEAFNELAELEIALQAVRKTTDLPVVAAMAFWYGPDKIASAMGDSPAELADLAKDCGAAGIGACCGTADIDCVRIVSMLRDAGADLPIWIAAGPSPDPAARTEPAVSPSQLASLASELVKAGARFIACAGPEHIRAVRQAVDGR